MISLIRFGGLLFKILQRRIKKIQVGFGLSLHLHYMYLIYPTIIMYIYNKFKKVIRNKLSLKSDNFYMSLKKYINIVGNIIAYSIHVYMTVACAEL